AFGAGSIYFTLSVHSLTGSVSYSIGSIQPGGSTVVPQYFSDRVNAGTQPFRSDNTDPLLLLLDAERSQLQITQKRWGGGKAAIDLFCAGPTGMIRGTETSALMRGAAEAFEVSLLLSTRPLPGTLRPQERVSLRDPCGKCDFSQQVENPPEFGTRRDVDR